MTRNVNDWERAASVAAGAMLMWVAMRNRRDERENGENGLARSAAVGLIARGIAGYCPINAAIGRGANLSDTRTALGGGRGIHVLERVVIDRPAGELFRFWRDFRNLPRFMEHLDDVEIVTPTRSIWTARAPIGMRVKWEAEVINEIEGELIGWQSTENADVATAGSVRFVPMPGGGTEIIVRLQYDPPAGKLGSFVASIFGEEPSQQIRADLQRLKESLETSNAWRATALRTDPLYT